MPDDIEAAWKRLPPESAGVPQEEVTTTMIHPTDLLTAARAEALFSSGLATGSQLTSMETAEAIRGAIRAHGGTRGCAAVLAAAYGDCPETAVPRMRWALRTIRTLYPRMATGPKPDVRDPAHRTQPIGQPITGSAMSLLSREEAAPPRPVHGTASFDASKPDRRHLHSLL
ncbi:hypothetical protein [Streptomyces poonensis]|uniref:Uncharacterized protein n=1 Tax=Streptomyces poonensis TaxID=68255 RepID=A0A918US65_9ACTN|nr:hypothetical protein [Streptomyces poonensis]GGZ29692.1 hypothetical protein GCM10010365_57580 [Streptomyces poonensis]